MSAVNSTEPTKQAGTASKKKKKSKKKANGVTAAGVEPVEVNGLAPEVEDDEEEDEIADAAVKPSLKDDASTIEATPTIATMQNGNTAIADDPGDTAMASDTTARLDAMQKDRDNLRNEVSQLRQELERIQTEHTEEVSTVREELSQAQNEKSAAETSYRKLRDQVNRIKEQLGTRLREDAEELEKTRGRIDVLETELEVAQEENQRLQTSSTALSEQIETQTAEITDLRSRTSLSTSNFAKERDDLLSKEAYLREEYEVAKQAMQDWEILATEERSRREAQEERVQELEDRLETQRQSYERAKSEADTQSTTVDGLQRALRDLQDERKKELRELVEQSQAQLDEARKQHKEASDNADSLKQQLDVTQKELERALPFEKEVKEKNLLIGKLRHEAVILNDHLTKALRFLKRGKPEDNVDRQLITNHFMQFLALDRSDPKKFEVLQLIAALLGWDEQKKEQAGLLRQGAGVGTLRVPMSPLFRRTPSTPSLSDLVPESPSATKESLAELWSDFLAREAESGMASGSRRPSAAASVRSATTSYGGLTSPIRSAPDLKRKESATEQSIKEEQ